jgi:hypothetical protein
LVHSPLLLEPGRVSYHLTAPKSYPLLRRTTIGWLCCTKWLTKPHHMDRLQPMRTQSAHSRWWEEAAQEVCRTSNNLSAVQNVLKLLPTPKNAGDLLSKRGNGWLDTCLQFICEPQAIKVPPCNSPESRAQAIVGIITFRQPLRPCNEDAIVSSFRNSTDIPTIAEKFHLRFTACFPGPHVQAGWRIIWSIRMTSQPCSTRWSTSAIN